MVRASEEVIMLIGLLVRNLRNMRMQAKDTWVVVEVT